ncbi:GH3 family domain-containing protein [Acinetobacter shaoyimingii]|uniref:GH3 auxin-responsive promoter family protein n=1 Tax=Acinetobacter shaoyimingii TaxID=2715164 RepID=A0A6G8RWR4_9GAMM|nr:GH3 auxin-responsive promoter family protein [Acinetobacter shaoyimingii]QIO06315.1 GH3 auxin-responsive promoter family protein [Acinetobacter shaoyimingii]
MALLIGAHQILEMACKKAYKTYHQQINQLENVQREKLKIILKDETLSYEEFRTKFPLTRYSDWKDKIENSREQSINLLNGDKIIRFQPTSGSSEALKFIPYTQGFLDELDQAIGLWLTSLYLEYPNLKHSTHYWSVSWLPESQRKLTLSDNLNDDSALLSFTKRFLTKITQAAPADIALAESAEDAMFATVVYLVADENLGMISVWSPTFALQLFEIIQENQQEIAKVLKHGKWSRPSLNFLKVPKSAKQSKKLLELDLNHANAWKKLWPKLELISSWDTASARHWALNLREKIANVSFEGKGLWATEGVVTIPLNGHYPLTYQSHFYEFLNLADQSIVPSWELKVGQIVSPILTTGSGLTRYVIDDELEVTAFYHQIPCFKFLGRKMTVDLVGEKIDQTVAQHILAQLKSEQYLPISLLGVELNQEKKPHYVLLSEGEAELAPTPEHIDALLKQNFHYELARNLGQLDEPSILHVEDAWDYYKKLAMHNGMIEGNIKPEPLKKMRSLLD